MYWILTIIAAWLLMWLFFEGAARLEEMQEENDNEQI